MSSNYGKVWRIESGRQLPTVPFVRTWLEACGTDAMEQARLVELAEAAHGETRTWGDLLAGVSHLQGVARHREASPGRVRNFQPTIVPALLQTPEYAARIIPLADHTGAIDHAQALTTRVDRQPILYDNGHRFQFLMVEAALRWSADLGDVAPAQLDRIVSLSRLDTVDIAVVQAGKDVVVPWHNFVVWEPDDDEPYVTTELFHGEQTITDAQQVEQYRGLWAHIWAAAAVGEQAREVCARIAQDHHRTAP